MSGLGNSGTNTLSNYPYAMFSDQSILSHCLLHVQKKYYFFKIKFSEKWSHDKAGRFQRDHNEQRSYPPCMINKNVAAIVY